MSKYKFLDEMREKMTEEKAKLIFKNINSRDYKVVEKTLAIDVIVDKEITAGLTKEDFLSVLKWLQTAMPWKQNREEEE